MLSEWLDKTGTLQRMTPSADTTGGNTPTATTIGDPFPCALWDAGSSLANVFMRRDIVGSHVIATASDLGAKADYRITVSGVSGYFLVNGDSLFSNAAVGDETLYLIDCTKRTV